MMKIKNLLLVFAFLFFVSNSFSQKFNPDDLLGRWVTHSGDVVKIFKKGNMYYGKIVKLVKPLYKNGVPRHDARNKEDASKKKRLLMGLEVLTDLKYSKKNRYTNGTIYSVGLGKTGKCAITLVNKNKLKMKVKKGGLSRTLTWKRKKRRTKTAKK